MDRQTICKSPKYLVDYWNNDNKEQNCLLRQVMFDKGVH